MTPEQKLERKRKSLLTKICRVLFFGMIFLMLLLPTVSAVGIDVPGTTLFTQYFRNGHPIVTALQAVTQGFNITGAGNYELDSISVKVNKTNDEAGMFVQISVYDADTNNNPTGAILETSAPVAISDIPKLPNVRTQFNFTGSYTFTDGETYTFLTTYNGTSTGIVRMMAGGTYANGTAKWHSDGDAVGVWGALVVSDDIDFQLITAAAAPAPGVNNSLTFLSPTPANNTKIYWTNDTGIEIKTLANTTALDYNYTNISVYNSSGSLLFSNVSDDVSNETSLEFDLFLQIGTYYYNATSFNSTDGILNFTDNRNFTIYRMEDQTFDVPNFQQTRYYNVTWPPTIFNPSGASSVVNYTLTLQYCTADCSFAPVEIANYTVDTNSSYVDFYMANLTNIPGTYNFNRVTRDLNGNEVTSGSNNFTIARSGEINISAVGAVGGETIYKFNGWVYHYETGINSTYTTTNGTANVDTIRGNITIYIDAENYSITTNLTLVGINFTVPHLDYQYSLYETNTLNITFYYEETPSVIFNYTTVNLDLIGDLFSNNYTTSNGTLYLTLLQPETYTLRYNATGYATRFYTVEVVNRTFTNINLYMINASISQNITVRVVDEVTNPVEGATVKALKYNLANNTYVLQEVAVTDILGQVSLSLTFNDEYYKFIVEYGGETKRTTNPAYITTTPIIIQINFAEDVGTEYENFGSIDYSFGFNTLTDNFRFEYNDVTGIASQFCVYVYEGANFTKTLFNSTCDTAASGTILTGVEAVNGTTYYAEVYYREGSEDLYLAGDSYTYPDSDSFGDYGLFLQILITIAMGFSALASASIAMILIPLSLIMGKYLGLNTFSMGALIVLQVFGVITAFILGFRRK